MSDLFSPSSQLKARLLDLHAFASQLDRKIAGYNSHLAESDGEQRRLMSFVAMSYGRRLPQYTRDGIEDRASLFEGLMELCQEFGKDRQERVELRKHVKGVRREVDKLKLELKRRRKDDGEET